MGVFSPLRNRGHQPHYVYPAAEKGFSAAEYKFLAQTFMLDHPITVVLNVFDTLKNNGLKVYKFMSIQTQEEHISHIKQ